MIFQLERVEMQVPNFATPLCSSVLTLLALIVYNVLFSHTIM